MQEENRKRGRSARNKGAGAERELARLIRDNYGYEVHRGQVFYKESDIVGLDGIHMEVKRVEKLNVSKAMTQAIEEAEKRQDGVPTVFHRRKNEGWLVTMKLEDWIDLYGAWEK